MYLKDSKTVVIKIGSSLLINDKKIVREKWLTEFAKDCVKNKINFIGICCGAEAHHVREMSVAIGKKPISMKYMPDMSKHFHHGTDKSLKKVNKEIKY